MDSRVGARRVGLFGGSYNPIHNGHLTLAQRLLERLDADADWALDEIWFLVSPHNPLKRQTDLMPDQLRLAMVRAAVESHPSGRLRASDFEFRLPRPSYMVHTLQALEAAYPQHSFILIIGADNWQCFHQWHRHDELLARHKIAIYPRMGSDIDASSLPPTVRLIDTGLINISSTEIRQRLAAGQPINGLVPPSIMHYLGQ